MTSRTTALLLLAASLSVCPVAIAGTAAEELVIDDAYVRAVPPGAGASAMFMTVNNTGSSSRSIVDASSGVARVVELHTHLHEDGVMRMRRIERIDIEAGGRTVLEPGGLHVMLIGLQSPLQVGTTVEVELRFADGSSKTVAAPVRDLREMHSGHDM